MNSIIEAIRSSIPPQNPTAVVEIGLGHCLLGVWPRGNSHVYSKKFKRRPRYFGTGTGCFMVLSLHGDRLSVLSPGGSCSANFDLNTADVQEAVTRHIELMEPKCG